jgi:hypothetical protein
MRRSRAFFALVGAVLLASCANPPQAAIDAAKKALDEAGRSADVITYAPDSLRAAREAASALDTELAGQMKKPSIMRRFDSVQILADTAKTAAESAISDATAAKAQVAQDAAALIDEVSASASTVESKVWAAKRVPRIKLDLIANAALAPTQARATMVDARKDIDSGAFAAAKAKLLAAKDLLAHSEETILEQTRIARSR